MRIVIFHARLAHLTGGEVNARDWSIGLKARGHNVIAYSLEPGPLAEQIRGVGIPIVTDPSSISEPPDIMFGTGVHDVTALIARFPDVPAIQVAQVFDHWNAYPCPLPQVVLHVAVDDLNAEMLANEFGVPRDRIRIIHNAVDAGRLATGMHPLPARPARALVFVKQKTPYLDAVIEACQARGIATDLCGYPTNNVLAEPERVVAQYDLVIGAARTALEGAVGGASVLVADHRGLAGLLTTANVDHYRKHNFGRELLTRPVDVSAVGAEIDKYDPTDAAAVSVRLRNEATLDRQLDLWERVFDEAIGRYSRAPPTADACRRALSSYLSSHLPRPWESSPRHMRLQGAMFLREQLSDTVKQFVTKYEAQQTVGFEQLSNAVNQVASKTEAQQTILFERLASVSQALEKTDLHLAAVAPRMVTVEARIGSMWDMLERNKALLRMMRPLAKIARRLAGRR